MTDGPHRMLTLGVSLPLYEQLEALAKKRNGPIANVAHSALSAGIKSITDEAAGYRRAGPSEVIVPKEPTEAMIEAGDDLCPVARGTESWVIGGNVPCETIYKAMLAAGDKK